MFNQNDVIFYGALLAMSFEKLFKRRNLIQDVLENKEPLFKLIDKIEYLKSNDFKTIICSITIFGIKITGNYINSSNEEINENKLEEYNNFAYKNACNTALKFLEFTLKFIDSIYPDKTEFDIYNPKKKYKCNDNKTENIITEEFI